MSKEPLAFPFHVVLHALSFQECSNATQGAIWKVVLHLWQLGFARLPGDDQVKRIGGISNIDWQRYEESIKRALDDVLPELQKRYDRLANTRGKRLEYLSKAWDATRKKTKIKQKHTFNKLTGSDQDCALPNFTPVFLENTHNPLISDLATRKAILTAPKTEKKQFTDQ